MKINKKALILIPVTFTLIALSLIRLTQYEPTGTKIVLCNLDKEVQVGNQCWQKEVTIRFTKMEPKPVFTKPLPQLPGLTDADFNLHDAGPDVDHTVTQWMQQ